MGKVDYTLKSERFVDMDFTCEYRSRLSKTDTSMERNFGVDIGALEPKDIRVAMTQPFP
ncbi:MAG: hypothetical protein AABX10_03135 [Nanoarchaeota archaeon]